MAEQLLIRTYFQVTVGNNVALAINVAVMLGKLYVKISLTQSRDFIE